MAKSEQRDRTTKDYEFYLNSGGHAFQYGVVEHIFRRSEANFTRSHWKVVSPEFPVRVGGRDTRIDIVLKHRDSPYFLSVECKRVNPKFSSWCFSSLQYPYPGDTHALVVAEELRTTPHGPLAGIRKSSASEHRFVHFGGSIATPRKGDCCPAKGAGRDAIDEALVQAARGANGLVEEFASGDCQALEDGTVVAPVVVTTADLLVSKTNLEKSDLESGIELGEDLEPLDWVLYQYPQSRGIKHSIPAEEDDSVRTLGDLLTHRYLRTVPIVSASSLDSFLETAWLG